jgi:hypothetical protein
MPVLGQAGDYLRGEFFAILGRPTPFAGGHGKSVQHRIPVNLTDNLKTKGQGKGDQGVFHIPTVHQEADLLPANTPPPP